MADAPKIPAVGPSRLVAALEDAAVGLIQALRKAVHNAASFKLWILLATIYLVKTGQLRFEAWQWATFAIALIGGRVAEYYSKNGNGIPK